MKKLSLFAVPVFAATLALARTPLVAANSEAPAGEQVTPAPPSSPFANSANSATPASSGTEAIVAPAATAPVESVPASDENLKVVRAEPADVREITTRLQIFLDQQNFGPGIIDGRPGEFTFKALGRYQKAHGLPVTKKLEDAAALPLDSVYPIYTTYTIRPEDLKQIGEVPRKPEFQAKVSRMPYGSLLEFLEERFHADVYFLMKLNKNLDLEKLAVGDTVRVPNVAPFKIEEVREIGKVPAVPAFKKRHIHVDTKEKMLDLFEGDALLASFPITPGSGKLPAPPGTWKIVGIATMPWFRHDEGVLNYGVRTDHFFNIPAGPNNPVGVVWMGLNKPGIGIHGTNVPETIGRAGSHGCIRVANWDVIRLMSMVTEGDTVVIDDGIPVPKPTPKAAPSIIAKDS